MGFPINCPDGASLLNGTFDGPEHWTFVQNAWIQNNHGYMEWSGYGVSPRIYQVLKLQIGVEYHVEFDILELNLIPNANLRMYLDRPSANSMGAYTTIGHKTGDAICGKESNEFGLGVYTDGYKAGDCLIDNIVLSCSASVVACEFNLLSIPGTKSEIYLIDVDTENIQLAHWNGNSNVLIELEK